VSIVRVAVLNCEFWLCACLVRFNTVVTDSMNSFIIDGLFRGAADCNGVWSGVERSDDW
jgi:hypothetical protein